MVIAKSTVKKLKRRRYGRLAKNLWGYHDCNRFCGGRSEVLDSGFRGSEMEKSTFLAITCVLMIQTFLVAYPERAPHIARQLSGRKITLLFMKFLRRIGLQKTRSKKYLEIRVPKAKWADTRGLIQFRNHVERIDQEQHRSECVKISDNFF